MKITPTDVDPNRLSLIAVKIGGLLFAVLVGLSIGGGAFQNAALVIIGVMAFLLWFYSYQNFLIVCIASLFFGGTNPAIPNGLRFFELLAILAVARLALEQVVLRRRKLERGPSLDWYLILGFMSIVVWHAVTSRMGMKIFGAEVWGGRQYIGIFLGFALYLGLQTVHIDLDRWRWLPIAVIIPSALDSFLTVIQRSAPEISAFIASIYDIGSEEATAYNPMDMGSRLGVLGATGVMIALGVLTYRRFYTLFVPRPSSLVFLSGIGLILAGAFRSSVLNAGLIFVAAAVRDLKARALFPLGAIVAAAMLLTVMHGTVIHLPEQVQRALVFLPGNWDATVLSSAHSSDDFRRDTWRKWREMYFPKNRWFGRGFGFNPAELAVWQFSLGDANIRESLLVTQELHNGFFSSLDCVGVVGTAFVVAWAITILWRVATYLLSPIRSADPPALRWTAFYLVSWTLLYWIGALKLSGFLPGQFIFTSLFIRLRTEAKKQEVTASEKRVEPMGRKLLPSAGAKRVVVRMDPRVRSAGSTAASSRSFERPIR